MEKSESERIEEAEGKEHSLIDRLKNMTPVQKRKAAIAVGCCAAAFVLLCFVQF